jgi:YVTN family beta-propeller protein
VSPNFADDGIAFAGGWKLGRTGRTGGYGIVRTADRGATWESLLAASPWAGLAVMDLAISPDFRSDATLYAATEESILRSTSRGDTWERLLGGLPEPAGDPALDDMARVSLSPGFAQDGTLLALQANGDLHLSVDRGNSWHRPSVISLTVATFSRAFPADDTLFAVTADNRLILTKDRGATWATIQALPVGPVVDMVQAVDGALLLATEEGVARLAPANGSYVIEEAAPSLTGAVHRLAVAGDRIYAAAEQGLYSTSTDGRHWDRYADTPVMPVRAVAACAERSRCRALLAGADRGVLGTTDDELDSWRWLAGLHSVAAASIAASPLYATDRTLFVGTDNGLFRSTDGGGRWQIVAIGEAPGHDAVFSQVRLSASYAVDGVLFAAFEDRTNGRRLLYRSADHGSTWAVQAGPFAPGTSMALAVSPAYRTDKTVFVAQDDTLHKSTDGGATWRSFELAPPGSHFQTLELEISSAFGADRTLFASGHEGVRYSTDGAVTWNTSATGSAGYGLAISPAYASDRTVWHTYRSFEGMDGSGTDSGVRRSKDGGRTWEQAAAGLPGINEPYPRPLAASPSYTADRTLYTALGGPLTVRSDHTLYRSLDGGQNWQMLSAAPGNPDPADLVVTVDALGRSIAHMATDSGVWHYAPQCEDRVVNGDFESDAAWVFPSTPRTAGYSDTLANGGHRSVRTGIVAPPDVHSYSTARQSVTIPAGTTSAVLRYAWYPLSAEPPPPASISSAPALELLQALVDGVAPQAAFSGDWQYVLLLDPGGRIIPDAPRMWTRSNAQAWQIVSLDLSAQRGRSVEISFGTLNDGDGRSAAMYVDDVSLTVCWPASPTPAPEPSPTSTPSRTATPGRFWRTHLPLAAGPGDSAWWTETPTATPTPAGTLTATPTDAPTSGASPTPTAPASASHTPTATTSATAVPTAEPIAWPTPHVVGTLALPNGSHPHGLALDTARRRAYVAFHGPEHDGRTLGIVDTERLALLSQVHLSATGAGPNGVAVIEPSGLVVVTQRQTASASIVAPEPPPPAVIGQIATDLLPNGVIVRSGFGYIANYGSNTVTVFDPVTHDALTTLHVGGEPSLFAADPASDDVYLSLHGSNQVQRLSRGAVVATFSDIQEPYGVAFDPMNRRLYVANRGAAHAVTVVNTETGAVIGTISLDREPYGLVVNPRTGHLYVACGDQVKIFRTLDWVPVTTIPAPAGAQEGIALDDVHNLVYLTSGESDTLTAIQDAAPPLVLFSSDRDGNGDLYRMLPDGRNPTRLTFTTDASESSPAGSPDGRAIAFTRLDADGRRHVWLMSRDGGAARPLTSGAWDDILPSWSGDGTHLAFATNRDGNWDIYALRLRDGALTRLTDDPADDTDPDWSWGTGRIAFQSTRGSPNGEIWTMTADGADARRLTTNFNGDHGPSWAPSGDYLTFFGNRAEQTVFRVRSDGSNPMPLLGRQWRPETPAWGPGSAGGWIIFSGYRPDSGYSEIFRMTSAGAGLALLTSNEVNFDYSPGWLPGQ